MSFVTTKQALEWLASEKGGTTSVASKRPELLDQLNDARRLFYTLNQKIRLDFHTEACFQVHEFYEPCIQCPCEPMSYTGITLPQEIEQVEAAWIGTQPITIYNRWMEYQEGIQGRGAAIKLIDVGNDFPLQIDWHPNHCIKPVFLATNQADCGKQVVLSFRTANGEKARETIKLAMDGGAPTAEVSQLDRPGGIILPADLKGGVEVYDCFGGKHLGFLSPKTAVPAFRRVKVTGACCGSIIRVRGSRKYTDVQFDWEVIETDNKLALIEAVRYLAIMGVNSSDAQWLAKARVHMQNILDYLGGDNLRDEGPTTVRDMDFIKQPFRKSGLRSRRRFRI